MKHRIAALAIALLASAAPAQTFVQHLKCELETASGSSLPPKTILQGTTPLWSLDQYRQGQAVAASTDGTVRAVVVLGQSATNGPWASITNYATSGYGYLVQFPVVGTNSGGATAAPWWYTVLYQSTAGKTYWSGSGRLTIEPTQYSGEDGLGWGASTNNCAVLIAAETAARIAADAALGVRIDNITVGPGLSTNDMLNVIASVVPTSRVAYAASAGTAGVATVALSGWPVVSVNGQTGAVVIATNSAFSGPYVATVNGQTGNVTVAASLPAGAIVATNTPVAGQSFFGSSGTAAGVITGYFATASSSGDMTKSEYDAGGVRQVVFTNDPRIVLALTNAAAFATAAQGAKADTALQPANTSGWVVASHAYLESGLSALTGAVAAANSTGATHTAQIATNDAFRVASSVNYATNAGNAATVGGLTSTQILATATNSFAMRSWVTGFSNAPATWNADFNTIDITNPDGTVLQVGQEQVVVVRNDSGYTITNGKACRAQSASGFYSSARLASATDTLNQVMSVIGLATMDIAHGAVGKITTLGNVNSINTTAFIEGSNLWLSATPGELTMAMPVCPSASRIIRMGQCLRSHANEGRIGVAVSHIPQPADICAETNGTAAAAAAGVSNALAPRIVALEDRTNVWNAAITNGQTNVVLGLALTQAATTTRESGFAGNELVTADFVRGLLASGVEMFPTTNLAATTITPTGTVYYASGSPLATATAFTLSVTGVNHYVMSILDTNVVLAGETLSGPANVEIWIQSASGAQTALSVKPELYLVPTQDVARITDPTIGDWDAAPQVITLGTTTNRYTWTITWPDHTIASNSYRLARLKVTTKGNNTTEMKIAAGGIYATHLDMKIPTDNGIGSRGATNATLDGVAQVYDSATRTFILTNSAAGIAAAGAITNGAIPGPGCTDLGTSANLVISGATVCYVANPSGVYTVSVTKASSAGYVYTLTTFSTNAYTLASGLQLYGAHTIGATNEFLFIPQTNAVYKVRAQKVQ